MLSYVKGANFRCPLFVSGIDFKMLFDSCEEYRVTAIIKSVKNSH